jgi:membrane protease subunit HflK
MIEEPDDFGPAVVSARQVDAWLSRFRRLPQPEETPPGSASVPNRPRAMPTAPRPGWASRVPRRGVMAIQLPSLAATLVLAGAVWAASGFYMVQPDQVGVVLRFGRWVGVKGPGLNYHLPAPIEAVLLPRVTAVNQLKIARGAETQMLTGDENIVEATAAVSWRVKDPGRYLFNVSDPESTVRVAAESAVREVIALNPIQSGLSDQRQKIADDARTLLQHMLDFYGVGIEITQVQLQKVDPPTAVIDAFNDVQRARADQQRARNEAEAYRNDILPRARGEAGRIKQEAQAYTEQIVNQARGDAARFTALDGSYRQSRDVTARRLYLDTMEEVLKAAGKVLIDPSGSAGPALVPYLSLNGAPTVAVPTVPAMPKGNP